MECRWNINGNPMKTNENQMEPTGFHRFSLIFIDYSSERYSSDRYGPERYAKA